MGDTSMFDFFDELDWLDIGLIGALIEEFTEDEKNIKKNENNFENSEIDENEDYS